MGFTQTRSSSATYLLLAVRDDCGQSFTDLYGQYRIAVRDYLASRAPFIQSATTDDMVQEVFSRSWQHRHRFRGQSSDKTYLIGIARNVLREHFAKAKRRNWLELTDTVHWTPCRGTRQVELQDLRRHVDRIMATLSDNQRRAVQMVCIDGRTTQEAADMEQTTAKAMRRRLEAARDRLRRLLSFCGVPCDMYVQPPGNCPARSSRKHCLLNECARGLS